MLIAVVFPSMQSPSYETLRQRISEHLIETVEDNSHFVKSRHIAADLDISAKRAGKVLMTLENNDSRFTLERWGGSSDGITWYVELNS